VDNRQAKEILELYRPGVDDNDPQFAEALALARRDPELRAWLDEQCTSYVAIRAKLKDIPVPAGLSEQIIAERRTIRPVIWWRSQFVRAAAAIIVICLSLPAILYQLRSTRNGVAARNNFPAFRAEMAYFAAARYKLDVHSSSFDELRQQFARNGWPSDYRVPAGLAKLNVEGGCLMKWQDHKVSMLCLKAPENHGVWLYVIERTVLPDPPRESTPQVAMEGNLATASWSEAGKTYLLSAEGDEAFLRKLL
jgi:hypothetical protein